MNIPGPIEDKILCNLDLKVWEEFRRLTIWYSLFIDVIIVCYSKNTYYQEVLSQCFMILFCVFIIKVFKISLHNFFRKVA